MVEVLFILIYIRDNDMPRNKVDIEYCAKQLKQTDNVTASKESISIAEKMSKLIKSDIKNHTDLALDNILDGLGEVGGVFSNVERKAIREALEPYYGGLKEQLGMGITEILPPIRRMNISFYKNSIAKLIESMSTTDAKEPNSSFKESEVINGIREKMQTKFSTYKAQENSKSVMNTLKNLFSQSHKLIERKPISTRKSISR